jgi:hypothetical protein
MSAPIVPFGTASAPSYLEGRAAAIQYATGLGFDESTFVEIPVRWGGTCARQIAAMTVR